MVNMAKATKGELGEPAYRGEFKHLPKLGEYCKSGKFWRNNYGSTSKEFASHVEDCEQCTAALEHEQAPSKN